MKPQTLKGFRDFLPQQAKKRQYAIDKIKMAFNSFGFEPLETPALEYEEILLGKYGEEGDKLMYRFTDLGGRKVALRYDQTVPLSRVVAQYGSANSPQGQPILPMPFKRYQIQPVFRAENTQKGRFREFLQCDADIVGTNSPLADAEVIATAAKALEMLGFKNYKILLNDRKTFSQLNKEGSLTDKKLLIAIRSLDKIKKIGDEGVIEDLMKNGFSRDIANAVVQNAKTMKENEDILTLSSLLEKQGLKKGDQFIFAPELARGLDYYTGTIFEIEIDGYTAGSVCGGGRYDKLIGMFMQDRYLPAGRQVPAVGFAFGFDRLIEAMETLGLFPEDMLGTKVLVTIFSPALADQSIKISSKLRSNNINTELYLDENAKMEKQLKYADQKGIPYVIIIGDEEVKNNMVTVKNMKTREQKTISFVDLVKELQ